MKNDRKRRITQARIDDDKRRTDVKNARHAIYTLNRPVDSDLVESYIKEKSYIPTKVCTSTSMISMLTECFLQNAFSERLGNFPGFNMFDLFVVDFMHEVELGVWRSLFIHLIRILRAVNPALVHELDLRYVYTNI